jgi:protein-L-isoaspartate(D-aspartate) O-methyltransferase
MTIEEARRWYAEEIRAVAHLTSEAVVEALARVPREAFLGAGPWLIPRSFEQPPHHRMTPDADPRHIYHNLLVAIDPARQLHNGLPSALAQWIEAAGVRPGDRVLHIGAGVGYYTAIFAELVGPAGAVVGYEVDPALAARAQAALAPWPVARVEAGDAAAPGGSFDAIFVNAGCTHPRPAWLAALAPGGRLVIPLTVGIPGAPDGVGGMLRAERRDPRWPARLVSQVGMYHCSNARDPTHEDELRTLVGVVPGAQPTAVLVDPHDRGEACLAHLPGFCLQR